MIFQVFGDLKQPAAIKYTGPNAQGLISFLNNIVALIMIIAGIWTVFNFISAGYMYLNSNNEPQKLTAAGNKILQSVIGLAIVATVYTVAGILGYILFQETSTFLKFELSSP